MNRELTGRRLEIARGAAGLPADKVHAYRERWAEFGYALPELDLGATPHRPVVRVGAALKRILGRLGLRAEPGCPCHVHAGEMDRRGPDWCERNVATIVGWLREEAERRGLPFVVAVARLLVRRAIRTARKSAAPVVDFARNQETSPAAASHPLAKHVTHWAVGITSAPRKNPTLHRCVESVIRAGFEPIVFAEPGTSVAGLPRTPVVIREQRLGCWRNWMQTLRDLLARFPDAQAIMIVQDDCVLARDVREFLEHDLWPSEKTGTVSIYAPNWGGYEQADRSGCLRIRGRFLMGAVANIFPRHVAEQIAKTTEWRGCADARSTIDDPAQKKAVDTFIGHEVSRLGKCSYYYTPSLCQHIATHSAIGHGGNAGKRRSQRFPGEDASAFDVFPPPWIRYDLPSGRQRFAAGFGSGSTREPVSIVIPGFDLEPLTRRCLQSIASFAGIPVKVVYVDNGSAPGVADRVEQFGRDLGLSMTLIRNATNLGFTLATNQGMRASEGRHVLLLNNDARLTAGCLPALKHRLETCPKVAAVGPLSDDHGHQSIKRANRKKWRGLPHITEETMLTGFCCLKHRDAIADVGLLDEDPGFAGGLGTDDDWCRRVRRKGWRLLLCYDAFAHHDHSSSFKHHQMDRRAMQTEAVRTLRSKR